ILDLGDRIAFELVCEFRSGHSVLLASKITKQGVYKSRGYSDARRQALGCPIEPTDGRGSTYSRSDIFCIGFERNRCFALPPGDYCESCVPQRFRNFWPAFFGSFVDETGGTTNRQNECIVFEGADLGWPLDQRYNELAQFGATTNGEFTYMSLDATPKIFMFEVDLDAIDIARTRAFVGIMGYSESGRARNVFTSLVADRSSPSDGCRKLSVALRGY
ncbi:hypothetical protein, partial [Actibacterium sp. D379-3]